MILDIFKGLNNFLKIGSIKSHVSFFWTCVYHVSFGRFSNRGSIHTELSESSLISRHSRLMFTVGVYPEGCTSRLLWLRWGACSQVLQGTGLCGQPRVATLPGGEQREGTAFWGEATWAACVVSQRCRVVASVWEWGRLDVQWEVSISMCSGRVSRGCSSTRCSLCFQISDQHNSVLFFFFKMFTDFYLFIWER